MSLPLNVLIIGGGTSGLALAQGLKKAGISYTVYERDAEEHYHNREKEWGFWVHWGMEYLQKCLPENLWLRLAEADVDPWTSQPQKGQVVINAATGDILRRTPAPPAYRLSRKRLKQLLSEGVNIEFGKKLSSISEDLASGTVTAHFDDSTTATGNVIVGCDGSKSILRSFVVGNEAARPSDSGWRIFHTTATLSRTVAEGLSAIHPRMVTGIFTDKPGLCLTALIDVPARDSTPDKWKFQIQVGWKGAPEPKDLEDPTAAWAFFDDFLSKTCEPFHSIPKDFPRDSPFFVGTLADFSPVGDFQWDNHGGKVILAGDSAHTFLPHRGQGVNHAVQDAAEVFDTLLKVSKGEAALKDAVDSYDQGMRKRGAEEVMLTRKQAGVTTDHANAPLATLGLHKPGSQEVKS